MFQDTFQVEQSKLEKDSYNPHVFMYIYIYTLEDRGSPMGRWGGVGIFTFIHVYNWVLLRPKQRFWQNCSVCGEKTLKTNKEVPTKSWITTLNSLLFQRLHGDYPP